MKYIYPCKPNRIELSSKLLPNLDNDPKWVAEVKRNGWRCLACKLGDGRLTLWTRHKTLIQDRLPDLRAALDRLPAGTMIDGELIERRTRETKGLYYAFDILCCRDIDVSYLPLRVRHEALVEIMPRSDLILLPEWHFTDKLKFYEQSIEGEVNEGIVLKQIDSAYLPSTKSCLQNPYWLKLKRIEDHVKAR